MRERWWTMRMAIVVIVWAWAVCAPVYAAGKSGAVLYRQNCARCHGEEARGNETIPRLAGQQAEYLKRTIARYRDKTGERIYPLMQIATATLKNEEIAALASYLAALP